MKLNKSGKYVNIEGIERDNIIEELGNSIKNLKSYSRDKLH